MVQFLFVSLLCVCLHHHVLGAGMLFPRESESREIKEINGVWNFRADMSPTRDEGLKNEWYKQPLSATGPVVPMPVPSSFNDIVTDKKLKNFIGWVWYDRQFFVPSSWQGKRIVLRIDSANYNSIVWVNAQQVMTHEGAQLPFEVEVTSKVSLGKLNNVTVALNNTLTPYSIPPGRIDWKTDRTMYPEGYFVQFTRFDFFNYVGIDRTVKLYTTPTTYVDDITITTEEASSNGNPAFIRYDIWIGGSSNRAGETLKVDVLDKENNVVASSTNSSARLTIPNAQLWWPWTMSKQDYAYQYTLQVSVTASDGVTDVYRQKFGIRKIQVTRTQFLINNEPFYCQGIGRHEDSVIRGKGLDFPTIIRDYNMMKWMHINCFRTSHYPYAEEIMDQADEQGFVVIDECGAVGLKYTDNFANESLPHHKNVMSELVRRDKNRPSVIMWSVANEPASSLPEAEYYFKMVFEHTRSLDTTRPVTYVTNSKYLIDRATQFSDVICLNRYYSWYSDPGHLEVIQLQLNTDLEAWNQIFDRPIILSEYGADTIAGMHMEPSFIFTEEFQMEFMKEYFAVFDSLKTRYLVGEMPWNFADFMTAEQLNRVVGNKKGLLTRDRQPKAAAHLLKKRYSELTNSTANVLKKPKNLNQNKKIAQKNQTVLKPSH